jgi:hypothetical protein
MRSYICGISFLACKLHRVAAEPACVPPHAFISSICCLSFAFGEFSKLCAGCPIRAGFARVGICDGGDLRWRKFPTLWLRDRYHAGSEVMILGGAALQRSDGAGSRWSGFSR